MSHFSIAGLQLALSGGDNLSEIADQIAKAKKRFPWLDMIVLSELCSYGSDKKYAESLPGHTEQFYCQLAEAHDERATLTDEVNRRTVAMKELSEDLAMKVESAREQEQQDEGQDEGDAGKRDEDRHVPRGSRQDSKGQLSRPRITPAARGCQEADARL